MATRSGDPSPHPEPSPDKIVYVYPLTRHGYEKNSLRIIFRNNFEGFFAFTLQISRKDRLFCEELRVKFVILLHTKDLLAE